jgi:hypothetical protein
VSFLDILKQSVSRFDFNMLLSKTHARIFRAPMLSLKNFSGTPMRLSMVRYKSETNPSSLCFWY